MSFFDDSHVTDVGLEGSAGPAVGLGEMMAQSFRQQFRVDSARALDNELRNRWLESLRLANISEGPATDPVGHSRPFRAFAQHVSGQPVDSEGWGLLGKQDPLDPIREMIHANERIKELNDPKIKTFEQILEEVAQMQQEVEGETASMYERSGTGGFVASLLGAMAGSFTTRDPLNLITAPIGAGRTVATRIASEMGIAAGITGYTELAEVAPARQITGLPERDPLFNITAATLGAGIIRGGIEGIGYGISRIRSPIENIDFDLRDAQLAQMFTMNNDKPSARAGAMILDDAMFVERNNPFGESRAAQERFIAELTEVQKAMNGAPMTAIGRVLPPVPYEYIKTVADFEIVREQVPVIYSRMEAAQQRVQQLQTRIAEVERLAALEAQLESIRARPGVNAGRMAKMLGPQLYGDMSSMGAVGIKEVLQNSFDAIKTGQLRGLSKGKIDIRTSRDSREIEITDNGVGMTPETLGTKFLEIAGTGKEEGASSGGFGIAKMLFLYGNDDLRVVTMRDGKVSEMVTKGTDLFKALEDQRFAPDIEVRDPTDADLKMFPNGHGTRVTMKLPKSYRDPKTGDEVEIDFPNYEWEVPSLKNSPLFADIDVNFNDYGVDIGSKFPIDEFMPFSNIDFGWGEARIYVTREPKELWGGNVHILSNGIHQFSQKMTKKPLDPYSGLLPYEFYIDISPRVTPEEPGYPFNFNRQSFTEKAKTDLNNVLGYINALYAFNDMAKGAESFGVARYFDESTGQLGAPVDLKPTIKVENKFVNSIKPGDELFVRDGRIYVNGKELPSLKEEDLKEGIPKTEDLKVDPDLIDPDSVMVHDNVMITDKEDFGRQTSFYTVLRNRHGEKADDFLYSVGDVFRQLRDYVVDVLGYGELRREAIGVSFDPEYRGVSIRLPFSGSFINPFLPESDDIAEAAYGLFGTMIHELAHHKVRSHNEAFPQEMQRLWYKLQASDDVNFQYLQAELLAKVRENEEVFRDGKSLLQGGDAEVAGNRLGGVQEDPGTAGGPERLPDGNDLGGPEGVGPRGIFEETERGVNPLEPGRNAGRDAGTPETLEQLRQLYREANKEYQEAYRKVEAEAARLRQQATSVEASQQSEASNILAQAYGRPFIGPLLRHNNVEALVERINKINETLDEDTIARFARETRGEGEDAVEVEVWEREGGIDIGLKDPVDPNFRFATDDGEMTVADAMRDLQDDADLVEAIKVCSI